VGGPATQAELREAFSRWGLPSRIRVDNGPPWGSDEELPTELACWLIGLGVEVVPNPPRRPQANGVVERSQGVGKRWAEPRTCTTPQELQRRLDDMDRRQREEYPATAAGQSRLRAHPGLAHSGRAYDASREEELWDLERLTTHLAGYALRRKVDGQGKISIYNTQRFIGRERKGEWVWVTFDPVERRWVVADERGQEIRRVDAPEVSREAVIGMRMCYRVPCRPAPSAQPVGRGPAEGEAARDA
jgi:hypothetical protein